MLDDGWRRRWVGDREGNLMKDGEDLIFRMKFFKFIISYFQQIVSKKKKIKKRIWNRWNVSIQRDKYRRRVIKKKFLKILFQIERIYLGVYEEWRRYLLCNGMNFRELLNCSYIFVKK